MGPGTQIHELAVLVERNRFASGDVRQTAQLVARLSAFTQQLFGLFARALEAFKLLVLFRNLPHLLFNFEKIIGRKGMRQVEIVIEPLLGGWADV